MAKFEKKIGIIIQARSNSKRLPNKILLPFYNDKNILELLIERLLEVFDKSNIILATTNNISDQKIKSIGELYNINVYCGDEEDVLKRFIDAAVFCNLDIIIRVCADNPFLDVNSIKILLNNYESGIDYISFKITPVLPSIRSHIGFFSELTTLNTLKKVSILTDEKIYREHVTNYIYSNENDFYIKWIDVGQGLWNRNDIRLTVDTQEDFNLMKKLYYELVSANVIINPKNILQFLDLNPHYFIAMKNNIIKNKK